MLKKSIDTRARPMVNLIKFFYTLKAMTEESKLTFAFYREAAPETESAPRDG
jgi:hypothetical protein